MTKFLAIALIVAFGNFASAAGSATLEILGGPTYYFGEVSLGTVVENEFAVINSGDAEATSISGSNMDLPFEFKGGAYPGTGGTCSSTLEAKTICTIVVSYAPIRVGTEFTQIVLTYLNGEATEITSIDITGSGK